MEVDLPEGALVTDYLHPEWANLRFFVRNPPQAEIVDGTAVLGKRFQATGPSAHPTRFHIGATRMWGIGLLPLGWARFVGVPAVDLANTASDGETTAAFAPFAPLCDVLCSDRADDEGQFRALVAFFRGLADQPQDYERILKIQEVMVDPCLVQVEEFAARVGFSKRTLERLCNRHFGFSPRVLLRRQRMMRTLTAYMLEGGSWTSVIDRHYHDQAHFVHEFHAFMGMSPTEYAAQEHPILRAFMIERRRVWGIPAQGLRRQK
ncbi:AraC family transcriptional regulator [Erythrobacter mangrovi]|uniref:AraC family transcriptional regulator n=2 Tax=Erythrobacter mangrovi TaxID=2739433 RepID=A0A7D4BXM9_9SPHN|nr:AraC family transcriptional regulator [Erythrobacter mangrovi]